MKRITTLLMSAGAFALAACSGGEGGNDAAANAAAENTSANLILDEANNLDNVAETVPAGAEKAEGNTVAAQPSAPASRRPNAPPKAAPAPRPERPKQVTPRPAPRPEPSPPPKTECLPEHRAAGHC